MLATNRTRGWSAASALLVTAAFGSLSDSALSCGGTPPPSCGKTVVLGQGLPSTTLLTGGGSLDVPVTLFVASTSFGGAVCVGPPFSATVTFTLDCPPMAPITSTVTLPVGSGYTPIPFSLLLPPGPPRVCTLTGSATVAFSDGTTITTAAITKDVCIVEPSPSDPSKPRLSIEHMSNPIARTHPGGQASMRYRIRNNDLTSPFSGTLDAGMEGASRLVTGGGIAVPGTGPFTVSEPLAGDNFPIAFGPIAPPNCVPLPPNPADPTIPTIARPLNIPAGGFVDVEIVSRPWGMCADGSCSKSKVRVVGQFAGAVPGLACTSSVVFADVSQAPQYAWADSGRVATVGTVVPTILNLTGSPAPGRTSQLTVRSIVTQATLNGQVLPLNPQTGLLDPRYGRFATQMPTPPAPVIGSFFDVFYDVSFSPPSPTGTASLQGLMIVPGAPNGFEQEAPMLMGVVSVGDGNPQFDSFFDIFFQVSLEATTNTGQRVPMNIVSAQVQPTGDPNRRTVRLQATPRGGTDGAPGATLVSINLRNDLRGFTRPSQRLFCPGDTNGDSMVNFTDLNAVLSQFGQNGQGLAGDVNGDGAVNFLDLNVLLSNFGRICGL